MVPVTSAARKLLGVRYPAGTQCVKVTQAKGMMMTDHAPKNQQDEFDWGEREIDEVEVVSEEQLEERFSESMAELYGEVEIMGQTFDAVYAYKELDPIGYTQAFVNWLDSEGYDELRPSILKALEEED